MPRPVVHSQTSEKCLSLIVAVAENGVIGRSGGLPWRLSADLQRFKRLTMGHSLVMGRKTYESIGRPLPGRESIVITSGPSYRAPGCRIASSLSQAVQMASHRQVFVIGGHQVYAAALPVAQRIFWTAVHAVIDGDTYFPDVDWSQWRMIEDQRFPADERNESDYSFRVYQRKETGGHGTPAG